MWSVAGLLLITGCGPTAVDEGARCLSVKVPDGVEGLTVAAPAKLSLFFGVDTCAGAPVAGLDASHFQIFEDDKPVSAFESQRSVVAKAQRFRMSSALLLDLSGSVLRSGQFPALKEAAAHYAKAVLDRREDGQRVAVFAFDGRERPQLLVDFTADLAKVQRALDGLETPECHASADCAGNADHKTCAGWRCVDDSTNLNGSVVQALDALDADRTADPSIVWSDAALVVFTDGTDEAGRVSQVEALKRARTTPDHVFTIGLGGEVDEPALRAFGKDGYFPAAHAEQLTDAFDGIASRVVGLANRFYVLEYCSPKRSGRHLLKVTATADQPSGPPLVGGLSKEFDATGFASGCEL